MEAAGFDTYVFNEILEQGEFPSGIVITFQVMAVSGMSAGDPDSIGPVHKSGQDELGG